jgi:hypothetical protein
MTQALMVFINVQKSLSEKNLRLFFFFFVTKIQIATQVAHPKIILDTIKIKIICFDYFINSMQRKIINLKNPNYYPQKNLMKIFVIDL